MAKKKTIDGQTTENTENLTDTKVNETEKVEAKTTTKELKKTEVKKEEKPKVKKRIRDFTVKEKKKAKGYCMDTFYEF